MLIAGGMSYHSARKLTGKLSKIITECRSDIAKERNERAIVALVGEALNFKDMIPPRAPSVDQAD
jgi:hypothetical protein